METERVKVTHAMATIKRLGVLAATLLLLTGCQSDGASHLVNGNAQALSVVRHKPYPWSAWEMSLVIRNDPTCQRRHRMKDVTGSTKVDLYSPAPGAFILSQGKRWYVAELGSCGFQQFKEEPALPGELIGAFLTRAGQYVFDAEKKGAADKPNVKPPAGA